LTLLDNFEIKVKILGDQVIPSETSYSDSSKKIGSVYTKTKI